MILNSAKGNFKWKTSITDYQSSTESHLIIKILVELKHIKYYNQYQEIWPANGLLTSHPPRVAGEPAGMWSSIIFKPCKKLTRYFKSFNGIYHILKSTKKHYWNFSQLDTQFPQFLRMKILTGLLIWVLEGNCEVELFEACNIGE